MNDKDKYINAAGETKIDLPLYFQPWWLDCVAGHDKWNVVITERDDKIVAALPYITQRRMGFKVLTLPRFTQFLGIWFSTSESKYSKKLAREKDFTQELIQKLPEHSVFFQSFSSAYKNWLPLFWLGFEQTTKYTYKLDDLSDLDTVWNNLDTKVRTDVRKARRILTISNDLGIEEFYEVIESVYSRQGLSPPYKKSEIEKIVGTCMEKNCGKLFFAIDEEQQIHACAFIAWDENSAYYLAGGGRTDLRNSGAGSLVVLEAIEFAASVTKSFDFEGSMVEGIERFFRGFGAKQSPYFRIRRFSSPISAAFYNYKSRKTGKI